MSEAFDIVVIGGGLAGSAAALALGRAGQRVAFVAPLSPVADGRTTALLMPAVELLDELGIWAAVTHEAAPLKTMRIIDGSDRLLRAPTVSFHCGEIGEEAFGYNIPNATLLQALDTACGADRLVTSFATSMTHIDLTAERGRIELADGTVLDAAMVVGADGRQSMTRETAGIRSRSWRYPQSAVVLTFKHKVPHDSISTEFHTRSGPFTQVPLPGHRSSLVWVVQPDEANRISMMQRDALNAEIERRMQSMLGEIEVDSPVQQFPLMGMAANAFGRGNVALVGEAGHVFPPIGAQGLNLGMRDVRELTRFPIDCTTRNSVEAAVTRYDRARRADIRSRTTAVDLLNRSLLTDFLPVHLARAAGLSLLSSSNPLRSFAVREGMRPGSALSALRQRLRERVGR